VGDGVRRYRVPEGIIDRPIGTELLVHRFDTDQVFVLNDDARRVFEAAREGSSDDAIRTRLCAEVFGDAAEICAEVDRALDEMRQQGLIELDDGAAHDPPE